MRRNSFRLHGFRDISQVLGSRDPATTVNEQVKCPPYGARCNVLSNL
jgi:hypothetical protein